MSFRSFIRGLFWIALALAALFHIAGGWYFSDILIEDAFVPEPDAIVVPIGDFEIEEVTYPTELGDMDAWYLPSTGTTWVIHVHGLGATPAEAEPLFAPLQDAGYPQLSIAYRNDEGQPQDPSGFYQYGTTEWADIASAVEYAEANGAEALVFNGYSTGASHILSFVYRHNLDQIRGIVLDSPNMDLGDAVDFAASMRELPVVPFNVPPTLSATSKFVTSLRIGVNWQTLDYVERAQTSLRVPVMIHHGTADDSVPLRQSQSLVEAAPELVDLVPVTGAGHVESYEVDPEGYLADVLGFLDSVA
ncbi:MAG: alpha/beta hydrolase [Actinobacteria bacterium]|nr:alpha/beta hydrolase [Actinomycetota bacterium]